MSRNLLLNRTLASTLLAGISVIWGSQSYAHHSFGAFDPASLITITGTVEKFEYTNPHTWLQVLVTNPDGTTAEWGLEGAPPAMMRNQGWARDSLHAGDKVTVTLQRRRDGGNGGALQMVTLPDGTVWLVAYVFEDWYAVNGWQKICITLQNGS